MPNSRRAPERRTGCAFALAGSALWCLTTGASYLPGVTPAELPMAIVIVLTGLPITLTVYAGIWLAAGVLAIAAFIWPRLVVAAFLSFLALCTFAAIVYGGSTIEAIALGGTSREWVTGAKYGAGALALVDQIRRERRYAKRVQLLPSPRKAGR